MMNQSIKHLLSMEGELDRLAVEGQWAELSNLAELRRQKLDEYFRHAPSVADSQQIKQAIETILANDKKRLQLIKQKRKLVINQSLQLKNSKNAIKQYRANG
jgi:hypothetical protein